MCVCVYTNILCVMHLHLGKAQWILCVSDVFVCMILCAPVH